MGYDHLVGTSGETNDPRLDQATHKFSFIKSLCIKQKEEISFAMQYGIHKKLPSFPNKLTYFQF